MGVLSKLSMRAPYYKMRVFSKMFVFERWAFFQSWGEVFFKVVLVGGWVLFIRWAFFQRRVLFVLFNIFQVHISKVGVGVLSKKGVLSH